MTLLRNVITDIKRPLDVGAGIASKRKEWWVLWLTGVFFVIGLGSILSHSIWGDEMHAWLIAARSNSLLDMVNNVFFWAKPMQESKAGDLDGAIRRLLHEGNSRVVVLQCRPWADLQNFAGLEIRELGRFDTAVFGEIYFIYLLQKQ